MTAFVAARINAMLDNLAAEMDEVSLHDGYPDTTGANEITGGAYARQAITWNAAATEALNSSNAPAFSVAGGNTIRWIGYWSDASPGVFAGYAPNQQAGDVAPQRFVVDTTADTIEAPSHGFAQDDAVVFFGGTAPTGLTAGTVYFVMNVTTDNFQVQTALQSPDSAIALSSNGDADVRFAQIREETFAGDGTFNLTDADVDTAT